MKRRISLILFLISSVITQILYVLRIQDFYNELVFGTVGVFMLLTFSFLYKYMMQVLEHAQTDAKLHALRRQQSLQEKQAELLQDQQIRVAERYHNTRESLEKLQGLVLGDQMEEAEKLLDSLTFEFQQNQFRPYCNDSLIHEILAEKRRLAELRHIQVQYQILLPKETGIQSADLSTVLFNLMDNAIEACEASKNPEPVIHLSIQADEGYLNLYLHNSKDPAAVFQNKTTKADVFEHGFGLSIIEDICRKYDGSFQWMDKGDFLIPLLC